MKTTGFVIGAFAAMAAIGAGPALAQKSKDTLRFGLYQPIKVLDRIFDPHPETNLTAPAVFDTLVYYNAKTRKYQPLLAESWRRMDATTMEFKLRKGVKFHDGSAFDADDVVYMVNFVTDPNVNFRFKGTRFGWIDKIEKVDQYTVRFHSKGAYAPILSRLSTSLPMYPSDYHASLKVKSTFGHHPIGTGPYKVTKVDPNEGIFFTRNDHYMTGDSKPAGRVEHLIAKAIPDRQTQIAELMSGGLDIMYNVPKDQAQSLAANPNIEISVTPTVSFIYILFDTTDRSGIHVFKDKRVRLALLHAIDRKALMKALVPKGLQEETPQQAICHPWHIGCVSSVAPPGFDLAKAKSLLAQAGYPDGFNLEITTWGPSRLAAQAVAGQLRRVGVKAKVAGLTIGAFVKKRAQGKVQTFVSLWDNGGAAPDVDATAGFFFMKGSRNYMGDDMLAKGYHAGQQEFDQKKRDAIYRAAFDRVTTEAYMMPLIPLPVVLAHTKDVKLVGVNKSPEGFYLNMVAWK